MAFGNRTPSTTPIATAAMAHQLSVIKEAGIGPSNRRPRSTIQTQPIAPMKAAVTRSLRVAGVLHYAKKFFIRRCMKSWIIEMPNVKCAA